MGRPPSPDRDKFIIRLPDGMRDQIKEAADANNRTMTAEIVARLRMTFDGNGDVEAPTQGMKFLETAKQSSLASHEKRLKNLEDRIAELEALSRRDHV